MLAVRAKSFPEGIMQSYKDLDALMSARSPYVCYGLSRMEDGAVVYFAAAEIESEELAKHMGAEYIVVRGGTYVNQDVTNWAQNIPAISRTFDELCALPGLDPLGYCVEWYFNEHDVHCMIRLADSTNK